MIPLTRSVLTCLLLLACVPIETLAQSVQCAKGRDASARALEETNWKQLNAATELVAEERYDEAFKDLTKMLGRSGNDKYLQAILEQALAQVEWSRENYDSALRHFEQAVELDALPNQAHFALMYQISQLYFMKERYQDALDRLDLWFCTSPEGKITAAAYVLKASIHAQMKDYRQALAAIEKAISMEPEPNEAWYQLKLAAHYELEQFPQATETLQIMIAHWPDKKTYWIQLAQTYYSLKLEDKALAVAALAHRKKLLDTQSDILFLSSLYANAEVPYKAADVLQKGIEDGMVEASARYWTVVADSWYAAEEMDKALAAYEKAGGAASNGDIDLRRAYILIDLERWPPAKEALDQAIAKGGLDERSMGEAYLLRGMAEFNLGNFEQASSDWIAAGRYPKTKEAAQQWMNHLQEERQRRAP
ncbi:MAG TPA: tetratricopeptide repeat protein [Xanthomonadales bacterium]|nr:tetratricopeptide repeat protein [Xanthomonadales bacterium]